MPKIVFRIALWSDKELKQFNLEIEDPNRNKLIELQGSVPNPPNPKLDPYRIVGVAYANLPFSVVGTYRILFGVDRKMEPI